ncbi:MAG: hypothetical protein HYW49_02320 [Deltaproteobacteria bacterium]|nr:hypothetical protein [Deltaproteobacteria bacterium]
MKMRDFEEFQKAESVAPPIVISERILARVHRDLNPGAWTVFLKLVAIHAVVGGITLLFCPQFGVSPFRGMGLMGLLMRFGDQVCMMGCGAFFMAGSLLMASLFLRPEEVRALRRLEVLQVCSLALLSIGFFVCFGSAVIGGLALFWVLGSILGGLGTLELGWALRQRLFYKS